MHVLEQTTPTPFMSASREDTNGCVLVTETQVFIKTKKLSRMPLTAQGDG